MASADRAAGRAGYLVLQTLCPGPSARQSADTTTEVQLSSFLDGAFGPDRAWRLAIDRGLYVAIDTAYAPNRDDAQLFSFASRGTALVVDQTGRPVVAAYDEGLNPGYSAFAVFRHDYVYSNGRE